MDTTSAAWGAGGTQLAAPGLTTSYPNDVLVGFYAVGETSVTLTLPAGMHTDYDYVPPSSPDINIGAADEQLAATGTVPSRTATSPSGHPWTAQLIALRP